MFQASANRLRTWLRGSEDILGDPPEDAHGDQFNFRAHPHRRPLRWERERRAGTVASRPAVCISPVRASGAPRARERATG